MQFLFVKVHLVSGLDKSGLFYLGMEKGENFG